jgi:hypothetical protein
MKSHPQTAATHTAPKGLARLSATQILDGYRAGDLTPRDVIDEVIVALEDTDALCKVMTTDMFASARAEADRAAAAWKAGEAKALTGVPITVKDLIYVAGTPASAGAPMLDGFVPDVDAAGFPLSRTRARLSPARPPHANPASRRFCDCRGNCTCASFCLCWRH